MVCLIIANKEVYYKEEGINVEFISIRGENVKLARKANEELKASGWKP